MFLAGIPVPDHLVLELARRVDDALLANRLTVFYRRQTDVLPLKISERETIIRALDDPPPGLENLRAVLLQEYTWRQREGL